MIKLKTEKEVSYIVSNILKACEDIRKLTRAGYNYLYLASGFIAHYNINGFKEYYSYDESLKEDILKAYRFNLWNNFRPSDENYEYYKQKAEIYKAIVDRLSLASS